MAKSLKKIKEAFEILENYSGSNPYIKLLKKEVIYNKGEFNDFMIEYVLENHNFQEKNVDKIVRVSDWFAEKKKEQWNLTFLPQKLQIKSLIGETENNYHVYLKYKQNQEKEVQCFIPKDALWDDLFIEDFKNKQIDFSKYEKDDRKLYEHQKDGVRFLLTRNSCLLADDQGLGKALVYSTLVYTDKGKVKICDLNVGDKVIGSDGNPYNVTGVFPQGKKELYKVTFNDGFHSICCGEHLWSVKSHKPPKHICDNRQDRYLTLSINQMLDKNLTLKKNGVGYNAKKVYGFKTYYKTISDSSKWQIPITKPITFNNDYVLPIDPYLLGLCLGDGYFAKNTVSFSIHKDDFNEMFSGHNIKRTFNDRGNVWHGKINYITKEIKDLGLHGKKSFNKFIPNIYKYASIEDRLSLLQGLMDTDGYCAKPKKVGCFVSTEYSTTSKELADDVVELVQCLGGIVRLRSKIGKYKKDGVTHVCRKAYRLNIKMPDGVNPFRLKRKSELYNSPQKYKVARYIESIEPYGVDEAVCISVDSPDKLYVTEYGIVTHNTTQLTIASLEGNFKKILVICPASLKTNWKRELAFYAPEEQIGIVNGDEWVSDKKYTIINYDIASRFYKIPKEKNGNKEVVSRKKEVIEKCLSESQLIQANFDLVIIDEAHKLSNNTSNRFKTISDFLKRSGIKDIYLVTGTPITNKPINYYNILSLIKHPITFNWEKFIKRYCEGRKRTSKNGGSFWEAKGASNLEELKEKTKNAYIRRMKDEIPGLPSKTIREIYYDLSNKEKQEYDSVWEKYVEKKKAEGQNSFNKDLTELILLRQFISQKMISRTIEFINDKLEDEKKVFVACCFTDEINKLKEYYGDKCVIYNGQMTQKQKDKAVHEFMNNDNVMVFCGNIIASGVGLTLTSSHICVYNSFEWVPGNNSQMCDRIHRISQTKDVEIYYQLFTNTISEVIWNTVVKKEITIDKVIVKEDDK